MAITEEVYQNPMKGTTGKDEFYGTWIISQLKTTIIAWGETWSPEKFSFLSKNRKLINRQQKGWGESTWLAQPAEHVTLHLWVMSSNPMSGTELTKKKKKCHHQNQTVSQLPMHCSRNTRAVSADLNLTAHTSSEGKDESNDLFSSFRF